MLPRADILSRAAIDPVRSIAQCVCPACKLPLSAGLCGCCGDSWEVYRPVPGGAEFVKHRQTPGECRHLIDLRRQFDEPPDAVSYRYDDRTGALQVDLPEPAATAFLPPELAVASPRPTIAEPLAIVTRFMQARGLEFIGEAAHGAVRTWMFRRPPS